MATETQIEALRQYLEYPSPHIRTRAEIVLQTIDGQETEAIANATGIAVRTVKKWQNAWAEQGLAIFPEVVATDEEVRDETVALVEPLHRLAFPEAVPLQATDTLAEAGRKIMLEQLQQILEHEPEVLNGKAVEAVHQMRIATRRWRSVYTGFGAYLPKTYTKPMSSHVRRIARYLGRVRDLDILLQGIRQYIKAYPEAKHETLESVVKTIKKDRKKARKVLRQWLDNKQYSHFIETAFEILTQADNGGSVKVMASKPVSTRLDHVLPLVVYEQFEAVRAYEELISEASMAVLHTLRVECKRLRYLLEAFKDVLGTEAEAVIANMKALQELLGDLNDAQNAIDTMRAYEKQLKKSERETIKAYRQSQKAQAEQLRSALPEVWSQFNRAEVRQALAQAVGVL